MKSRLLCIISTIVLGTVLSGCSPFTNNDIENESMGQIGQAEFIIDTNLPDSPEKLAFYKIVPPDVTVESVENLGALLDFEGEAGFIPPYTIGMSVSGIKSLRVNTNTGAVEFNYTHKLFQLNPELPSYEEAATIATNFLKDTNLWFSDLELKGVSIGGTVNTAPSHLLVSFTQYIDGFPLTGLGSKYGIRICDKGEIGKALIWHPELENQGEIQCIDANQACDNLISGNETVVLPSNCKEVRITNIYIGYYLESIVEEQEYVTPVYVFEGECLTSDGTYIEDFTAWIKATS